MDAAETVTEYMRLSAQVMSLQMWGKETKHNALGSLP